MQFHSQAFYPDKRLDCGIAPLDLCKMGRLTFIEPDKKRFPALELAYKAIKTEGVMPAVLNAADEVAVDAFLQKEIRFTDITKVVENVMKSVKVSKSQSAKGLKEILEADRLARETTQEVIRKFRNQKSHGRKSKHG